MRSVVISMIFGSLLGWSSALFAEETSVLKDVSTSVLGGHTRVAFQFTGDVRFSTEQAKNGVRIVFSRTRVASSQALSHRALNAGPLESIGFQRPATDCVIAALTFVPGSTYRCISPAGGNELYVDVRGSAAVRVVAPPKPAPARSAPAQSAVIPPPVQEPARPGTASALIDIPAVARHQMESESADDARNRRKTGETPLVTMPSLIVASVGVSIVVTGLVLLALSRLLRKAPAAVPVVVAAPALPPMPRATVKAYQQHRPEVEEEEDDMKPEPERVRALFGAPPQELEIEEDAGHETSLQLARTFRRGSEEITLARKFHERPSPALTTAKMQTAMSRATTKSQRLSAARKLGVGRGEFDLAEKLKTMTQPSAKKEEEQP